MPMLDLGMAIRAEEKAFPGFLPKPVDSSREATERKPELLRLGVEVVEMQRAQIFVVSTELTSPTSLCDEDRLRAAAASNHGL